MKRLYDITYSRKQKINGLGFDYEGQILKRTISSYLFKDEMRSAILQKFEEWIFFLVEKIKMTKTFFNYAVKKDYTKLN